MDGVGRIALVTDGLGEEAEELELVGLAVLVRAPLAAKLVEIGDDLLHVRPDTFQ